MDEEKTRCNLIGWLRIEISSISVSDPSKASNVTHIVCEYIVQKLWSCLPNWILLNEAIFVPSAHFPAIS